MDDGGGMRCRTMLDSRPCKPNNRKHKARNAILQCGFAKLRFFQLQALHMPAERFHWDDPLRLEAQLSADERAVQETAAAFCTRELAPRVLDAFRHETTDPGLFRELGGMCLLGSTLPSQYGGGGLNQVCYGLIAREVERIDSGYRSMLSVQSSLVMLRLHAFGTEAQRRHYLPKLASGAWIGCFGLTEPDHGSDPGGRQTRAVSVSGGFRLRGSKMWISSAPIADVFVVWAKNDAGVIRGYILDKGMKGLSAPKIEGKVGLRTSITRLPEKPRPSGRGGRGVPHSGMLLTLACSLHKV